MKFLGAGDEVQAVGIRQPSVAEEYVQGVVGDQLRSRQAARSGSLKLLAGAGPAQDGVHRMEDAVVIVQDIDCLRSIHEWHRNWELTAELVGREGGRIKRNCRRTEWLDLTSR